MKPIMTVMPDGRYSICYQLFSDLKSIICTSKEEATIEFRRIKKVLAKHRKGRPERVW